MTTTDRIVICAVDLGPLTTRVLYHAAAFARVLGARLKVVHVAESATSIDATDALSRAYARAIPYGAGDEEPDLAVRTGSVGERILQEANRPGVEMLVTGTRALGPLAEFVLGSISQDVLRGARVPVLLVPPSDLDIAFLGSARAALTCGPVLTAIDLAEFNSRQLHMASVLAGLAGEGLLFLTVAENGLDDPDIGAHLRDRAQGLAPVRPTALIVRRGDVVAQIAECVRAERSGLVVMGLRERARGRPGQVAAGVLRTGPAFVLAVPDVAVASNHHGRAGLRPGLRRAG